MTYETQRANNDTNDRCKESTTYTTTQTKQRRKRQIELNLKQGNTSTQQLHRLT